MRYHSKLKYNTHLLLLVFLLITQGRKIIADPIDDSRIDAVPIEAVQTYMNPKNLEVTSGIGFFPLDPYSFAFSLDAGVTLYFNTYLGWEIVHGSYATNIEKNLRAQLASLGVSPKVLELLHFTASSALVFVPAYGKSVLFQSVIQHSRTAFFIGPGIVQTSLTTNVTLCLGFRFESYLNDTFSYRFELRDNMSFKGGEHYLSVSLGVGAYF